MKYAAYDENAVYGIGATIEEAIADAHKGCNEGEVEFATAQISDQLYDWIKEHGWFGKRESFSVRNGILERTTDNPDA